MISVEKANQIIQDNLFDFGIDEISLDEGMGRILRESVHADRELPPYDRVTMDGIAIRFEDFKNGQREFEITGIAAAGSPKQTMRESGKCIEVMTGSIMPEGLDTVIRYEDIDIKDSSAKLLVKEIQLQQNIHFKGEDRNQGDLIIKEGKQLDGPEIGVCATVGLEKIKVSRLPKAIIISTGDELIEIDKTPLPHQIRRSNVYRIRTILKSYQIDVSTDHINDDYETILDHLRSHLENFDLIILSGGVSMGKFDYLPKALEELGVDKLFHKITQRPGKPFWLGRKQNHFVFAFPGNPVSSFMCSQQYFKPWLDGCLQKEAPPTIKAVLNQDVHFKPDLTYFLEVKLSYSDEGKLLATPAKGNGSGDLANLVEADGFIVLPKGQNDYHQGEVFPILKFRVS